MGSHCNHVVLVPDQVVSTLPTLLHDAQPTPCGRTYSPFKTLLMNCSPKRSVALRCNEWLSHADLRTERVQPPLPCDICTRANATGRWSISSPATSTQDNQIHHGFSTQAKRPCSRWHCRCRSLFCCFGKVRLCGFVFQLRLPRTGHRTLTEGLCCGLGPLPTSRPRPNSLFRSTLWSIASMSRLHML